MTNRTRKTVNVTELKARVNRALSDAADYQDETMGLVAAQAFRRGMAAVLEDALMTSGNYRGFGYAATEAAERTADGYLASGTYDETRRTYY